MLRLKKIFYFVLGMLVVPAVLGKVVAGVVGADVFDGINFFGLVYFLVYLLFALLYRGKVKEMVPNRYVFYGGLYLPFIGLFVWLYL